MFNTRHILAGVIAIVFLAVFTNAFAFLNYDGSDIAMGRSHNIYDRGAWTGRWNPSLLDRSGAPRWSVQFLSLGIQLGNNTLSRNDYQRLFTGSDNVWDNQDKEDILGQVPGNGLKGFFTGSVTGVGVSVGRFALNIQGVGAARAGIPKDFLTLALYGNELNRSYSFDDIEADGWGAITADFSVGHRLDWKYFDEFAVGATFRYIRGLVYGGVETAEGEAMVSENGATGYGNFETCYGFKGDGVGLDLAASALWKERWEFGITLGNLIGTITWELDSTRIYGFDVTSGEVDLDSLDDQDYLDRLFNEVDTTYGGGTSKSRLPFYIQLNAGYQVNQQLIATAELLQGTSNQPGASTIPRLTVAGEYRYVHWLPVRLGVAVGGTYTIRWGCGFGLDFNNYTFDLGVSGIKGFFGSSHGLGFALTNRIMF
jgi:hypothetical protein